MLLPLLLPWIPGLRDIPRLIPLYKIIYRKYYEKRSASPPAPEHPRPMAGSTATDPTNTGPP